MFERVLEQDWIYDYLMQRNLVKQYLKAKKYLLLWNLNQISFKLRKPKQDKIYYFKINEQYRALCYIDWKDIKIFKIDNHQN